MEIIMLSSKGYEDKDKRYGDCTIIDYETGILVYDCGSLEHANRVIEYLKTRNIKKVDIVLSHNDADHFDGIPTLIENGVVNKIYTVLVLKYIDQILDKIDDKRKNRESLKKQIKEIYSNINELSGNNLVDAIETEKIIEGIKLVGPSKDYFIEATSKLLDTTESDQIDGESITNATSIQLEVKLDENKLFLCGDASFKAIEDKISNYQIIQLPHHGKLEQAEQIFDAVDNNHVKYIVSDNSGNTNGGSDDLPKKGYDIQNTKNGDIEFDSKIILSNCKGSYGENDEMYNFK